MNHKGLTQTYACLIRIIMYSVFFCLSACLITWLCMNILKHHLHNNQPINYIYSILDILPEFTRRQIFFSDMRTSQYVMLLLVKGPRYHLMTLLRNNQPSIFVYSILVHLLKFRPNIGLTLHQFTGVTYEHNIVLHITTKCWIHLFV